MTPEIGQELDYPPIHVHGCPDNFGLVVPGVYRSSYPKPDNYRFLQGLRLKTVV
jgi:tyrosine-protein phosphatase SIW14